MNGHEKPAKPNQATCPTFAHLFASRLLLALAMALISLLAVACAVNPVSGRSELMLYSEEDEIALGQKVDEQIRSSYGIYADQRLNAYVDGIGQKLAPHTHRTHLTYHYAVLDSSVINAFAAPGGYIYVTRGILALMNSEAELAVVLGHELGHVNARHSMSRMSTQSVLGLGLAPVSILARAFPTILGAAGAGIQLLSLKYSRDDEREADELGIEYSRKGDFNPAKMIDFFTSLETLGDLSGGQTLPGFLSTHPLTSERIQNTKDMILETDAQLKVEQSGYFNSIDNMVFGPDPRQGFVEENTFYHPDMRFVFSIPKDWKVQNDPSKVFIVSEEEDAATILQADKSSADPQTYSQNQLSKAEGITILEDRSLKINGLSAYQVLMDYSQPRQSDISILLTYIQYNSFIYTFTSFSAANNYSAYSRRFQNTAGSFQRLRDPKYLNRQPQRLKFVTANA
ncbi:MAG: M48 family metalloprotease [Candidatus Aminicenantes bacterium]|nr:M48 family metalloprotease [Candidatus Aminicenantes bacterium]